MSLVSLTERKFETTCVFTASVATASFTNVQIALTPLVQTYVCFFDVVISVKVVSVYPRQRHPTSHACVQTSSLSTFERIRQFGRTTLINMCMPSKAVHLLM